MFAIFFKLKLLFKCGKTAAFVGAKSEISEVPAERQTPLLLSASFSADTLSLPRASIIRNHAHVRTSSRFCISFLKYFYWVRQKMVPALHYRAGPKLTTKVRGKI